MSHRMPTSTLTVGNRILRHPHLVEMLGAAPKSCTTYLAAINSITSIISGMRKLSTIRLAVYQELE